MAAHKIKITLKSLGKKLKDILSVEEIHALVLSFDDSSIRDLFENDLLPFDMKNYPDEYVNIKPNFPLCKIKE